MPMGRTQNDNSMEVDGPVRRAHNPLSKHHRVEIVGRRELRHSLADIAKGVEGNISSELTLPRGHDSSLSYTVMATSIFISCNRFINFSISQPFGTGRVKVAKDIFGSIAFELFD
jgi:hypothetical protein